MIDLHSHILFDIDDGSSSVEESISLLKKMKDTGFDSVILTPHYIEGSKYASINSEKLKRFNVLKKEIKKNNIDINIYLGNEIFISDKIVDRIKEEKIYPLNNGKYILVELPFNNNLIGLKDILYEIKCDGYIPIIAHPERYSYFQKNYKLVDSLKKEGVLFQCNFGSIIGEYGIWSKRLVKYMFRKKYIDFLGTDIHHISRTNVLDNFDKIEKYFRKIDSSYYDEIIKNGYEIVK